MLKKYNINDFILELRLKSWFSKLGNSNILINNNMKSINSLENAMLIWNAKTEIRKQKLDEIKYKLNKDDTWLTNYESIVGLVYTELKKNTFFNIFIRDVKNVYYDLNKMDVMYASMKYLLDPEYIISQLPIIGYFGETLINKRAENHFSKEIELFKKGHFVVEHIDNKFLLY